MEKLFFKKNMWNIAYQSGLNFVRTWKGVSSGYGHRVLLLLGSHSHLHHANLIPLPRLHRWFSHLSPLPPSQPIIYPGRQQISQKGGWRSKNNEVDAWIWQWSMCNTISSSSQFPQFPRYSQNRCRTPKATEYQRIIYSGQIIPSWTYEQRLPSVIVEDKTHPQFDVGLRQKRFNGATLPSFNTPPLNPSRVAEGIALGW